MRNKITLLDGAAVFVHGTVTTPAARGRSLMLYSNACFANTSQVVKDYQRQDPRARPAAATKMVVSPITGEMIPVDQMAEHMRISLIDPRWKQQRDAMLSKIRDTTKASDDEISRNLVGLARSRPDVFGRFQGFPSV